MRRFGSDEPRSARKPSAMRPMVLALCAAVIAVFLISPVYVATHANHAHDNNGPGGRCATCVYIASAENLQKTISLAVMGAALGWRAFFAVLSAPKPADFSEECQTPVRLKVRMNN